MIDWSEISSKTGDSIPIMVDITATDDDGAAIPENANSLEIKFREDKTSIEALSVDYKLVNDGSDQYNEPVELSITNINKLADLVSIVIYKESIPYTYTKNITKSEFTPVYSTTAYWDGTQMVKPLVGYTATVTVNYQDIMNAFKDQGLLSSIDGFDILNVEATSSLSANGITIQSGSNAGNTLLSETYNANLTISYDNEAKNYVLSTELYDRYGETYNEINESDESPLLSIAYDLYINDKQYYITQNASGTILNNLVTGVDNIITDKDEGTEELFEITDEPLTSTIKIENAVINLQTGDEDYPEEELRLNLSYNIEYEVIADIEYNVAEFTADGADVTVTNKITYIPDKYNKSTDYAKLELSFYEVDSSTDASKPSSLDSYMYGSYKDVSADSTTELHLDKSSDANNTKVILDFRNVFYANYTLKVDGKTVSTKAKVNVTIKE